ncbi:hypothetical protein [Nocardia sp. NPDC004722]
MSVPHRLQQARHLSRKLVQAHRAATADRAALHHRRVVQDAWRGAR